MTKPKHRWLTTFAFTWLVAFAAHTALLHHFTGSTELSAVFAGLTRLSPTSLTILASFVALRMFVMLLAPAAVVSAAWWIGKQWMQRARA